MGDQSYEGVRQGDMLQMFREFAMYMRQQQNVERMEESITKALQSVVNKVDQFEGRDVSKYIKTYQREMELNRVSERQMVENFERGVVPKIKEAHTGEAGKNSRNLSKRSTSWMILSE